MQSNQHEFTGGESDLYPEDKGTLPTIEAMIAQARTEGQEPTAK